MQEGKVIEKGEPSGEKPQKVSAPPPPPAPAQAPAPAPQGRATFKVNVKHVTKLPIPDGKQAGQMRISVEVSVNLEKAQSSTSRVIPVASPHSLWNHPCQFDMKWRDIVSGTTFLTLEIFDHSTEGASTSVGQASKSSVGQATISLDELHQMGPKGKAILNLYNTGECTVEISYSFENRSGKLMKLLKSIACHAAQSVVGSTADSITKLALVEVERGLREE